MGLTERTHKIEGPRLDSIEQIYARPSPHPSIPYNARRDGTGTSGAGRVAGGQITSLHATPNAQDIDNDDEIPDYSGMDYFEDGTASLDPFEDFFMPNNLGPLRSYQSTGGGNSNASTATKTFNNWIDNQGFFAADQILYYKLQSNLLERRRDSECRILQEHLDHIQAEGQCPTCGARDCETTAFRNLQVIGIQFVHNLRLAIMHCEM